MGTHKLLPETAITFDDVLLDPRTAMFDQRDVNVRTVLHESLALRLPIISSPMDRVTEKDMAQAMAQRGGLGVIHRNLGIEDQVAIVRAAQQAVPATEATTLKDGTLAIAAAVGSGPDLEQRVQSLMDARVAALLVDSAHGASKAVLEALSWIRNRYPHMPLIAGSVANTETANAVIAAGANILRCGIGGGSICTTRIVTGAGVPQVTAIMETVEQARTRNVPVIADGGIRQIGDMAKAIAAGAHAVMLGKMLAGYDEAPGKIEVRQGKTCKEYRGMGSFSAQREGSASRYGANALDPANIVPEGVEGWVESKGPVGVFLSQARGALQRSFFYAGCATVEAMHEHARFRRITPAALSESHPHDVRVENAGSTYMQENTSRDVR